MVRKSVPSALKKLGIDKYGINEQFPKEINEKRRELYPHYKAAKKNNRKVSLVYDKLYIDGKLFHPSEPMERDDIRSGSHRTSNLSAVATEFTPRNRPRGARGNKTRTDSSH